MAAKKSKGPINKIAGSHGPAERKNMKSFRIIEREPDNWIAMEITPDCGCAFKAYSNGVDDNLKVAESWAKDFHCPHHELQ